MTRWIIIFSTLAFRTAMNRGIAEGIRRREISDPDDAEYLDQLIQPASADFAKSGLILLDLLEADIERLADFALAESQSEAAHPQSISDFYVEWV